MSDISNMDVEQWEAGKRAEIAEAFPQPSMVVALRETIGPSLDQIPVTQRKTVAVDKNVVSTVQLSGEWVSDDWDKVAAYAIYRMAWGQLDKMVVRVVDIGYKDGDKPDSDEVEKVIRNFQRALHAWACETYNK